MRILAEEARKAIRFEAHEKDFNNLPEASDLYLEALKECLSGIQTELTNFKWLFVLERIQALGVRANSLAADVRRLLKRCLAGTTRVVMPETEDYQVVAKFARVLFSIGDSIPEEVPPAVKIAPAYFPYYEEWLRGERGSTA
jgi:hypothetical protein